MRVKYKVLEYRPEVEWIAVEFTHPDRPDEPWVKQFTFPDFNKEKLMDQIRAVASRIAGSWDRIPNHPTELTIPAVADIDVVPELYLPYEPNPQLEPEPDIDYWTQAKEPMDVSADPFAKTIPWIVRELSAEEQQQLIDMEADQIRRDRNWALMQTDWIFAPDVTVENMDEWLEFRQALRDVPQQANFPKEVEWPRHPNYKEDGSYL